MKCLGHGWVCFCLRLCVLLPVKSHTHNCLMALLDFVRDHLGEPAPERYNQSGFTGARVREWQWHQLGHMQICTLTQTPASHHSVFYRLDALPTAQPTVSKHWRQIAGELITGKCVGELCINLLQRTVNIRQNLDLDAENYFCICLVPVPYIIIQQVALSVCPVDIC